jgi:hypothetical protein
MHVGHLQIPEKRWFRNEHLPDGALCNWNRILSHRTIDELPGRDDRPRWRVKSRNGTIGGLSMTTGLDEWDTVLLESPKRGIFFERYLI